MLYRTLVYSTLFLASSAIGCASHGGRSGNVANAPEIGKADQDKEEKCSINQSPGTAIAITVVDTLRRVSADVSTRRQFFAPTVTEEVVRQFVSDYLACVKKIDLNAEKKAFAFTKPVLAAAGVAQSVIGNPKFSNQAERRAEVDRRFDSLETAGKLLDSTSFTPAIDASKLRKRWPNRPTITGRQLDVDITREAQRVDLFLGSSIPAGISTSALSFATMLHDELISFLDGSHTPRDVADRLFIALRAANLRAVDDDMRPKEKGAL